MPVITLPDGSQRAFDNSVSVLDVANDIGPGLAKATIAGKVNGELVDAVDNTFGLLEAFVQRPNVSGCRQNVGNKYKIHQVKIGNCDF